MWPVKVIMCVGIMLMLLQSVSELIVAKIELAGSSAFAVKADVSQAAEVEAAAKDILERFKGRMDTLWNHAGTVREEYVSPKILQMSHSF